MAKGLWRQLDALDKRISERIFAARLPFAFLELLLSVPGNFFGSCSFALVTSPSLVAIAFEGSTVLDGWHFLVGGVFLSNLLLWRLVISPEKNHINCNARRFVYGPLTGAVAPIFGVTLLTFSPLSTYARQMGYIQLCTWSIGVLPTATIKPWIARQRPASWILEANSSASKRLQTAAGEKHLNTLPALFARDAYASMPSGDTAGAMGCMYPLLFLFSEDNLGARIFGLACIAMSCFGRVYWMAHHVGDASVGVFTSLLACQALLAVLYNGTEQCLVEWWTPLVMHGLLLCVVMLTRWYFKSPVLCSGSLRVDDVASTGQEKFD